MNEKINKIYWIDNTVIESFKKIKREDILDKLFHQRLITTEMVNNEIKKSRNETTLRIPYAYSSNLPRINYPDRNNYSLVQNESADDSLIIHAFFFGGVILTNDKKQTNKVKSIKGGRTFSVDVEVHGSIWVLIQAVKEGLLNRGEASALYAKMREMGEYLPPAKKFDDFLNNN